MSNILKLGKLCLAEECALEGVHIVGKEILFKLYVRCGLKQVLEKKYLVYGACNLRNKNAVACLFLRLISLGEIGVHCVSELMSDSKDIACGLLIVKKHIGVLKTVYACAVRTASLAVGLLNVYPAVVVSLLQKRLILLAERSKAFLYKLERVLIVELHFRALNDRGVYIIHMKL